jgi:GrpB-like predicted nucleotidyltransferase (UPF0157 family)
MSKFFMRIIEVLDYSGTWPERFQIEKALISGVLKNLHISLHHIGSTSVPGLAAKPIIDILMETNRIADLDDYEDEMMSIGFIAKGEFGIPGRRYFQKGDRTHHLHAFGEGDPGLKRHLAYRDYLRAFPKVCADYTALKKSIALTCNNDIDLYCSGKEAFVKYHEQEALSWVDKNRG